MYNKPATEVTDLKTVGLMQQQTITVSPGGGADPTNPPTPNAPARGGIIE